MKTVYLDTETTGLDPGRDELLEIAIVDDQGNALVNTLIRPQRRKQWQKAQRIHGIEPSDVRGAPTLEDVLPDVVAAISGARLVIYNAVFDMGFLPDVAANAIAQVECCMVAFAVEYGEYSDYHGNYRWQPLDMAARYVGHDWQGTAHRALSDALACRAVWHYLTGSASYRAEVDACRLAADRRADALYAANRALEQYERRISEARATRWWSAQKHSKRLIQRFFLRQTASRHWLSQLPSDQAQAKLAAVFLGLPDNLPPECYAAGVEIQAIYHRNRDIPDHLATMNWFPNEKWIRRLLTPVAAFVGPRSARALFAKSQLDEIKQEYWLRFAPAPEWCCTRTMLREEGYADGVIDSLPPAAERYNMTHHFWYPIYDREEISRRASFRTD
ncbi:3'-5' exonuclease [Vreelandella massiliensis]|uniref:3'-5' exonuclease n=1 Tax=Vreelandella massiliensis TaxID=1816686 RepID=UPI00096A4CF5|nr:3'-5' exonuclease [Halomonas massiliensis]